MAITINVGGSKKVSQNYDSQGVSLNVTAEVPNDAIADPQKIASTANELFDLVNGLLDQQIAKLSQPQPKPANGTTYPARSTGRSNGHNNGNGNGNGRYASYDRSNGNGNGHGRVAPSSDRKLTQAQHRAINTMIRRLNEDGDAWVQHEYGADRIADLTVRQASQFIDLLKNAIDDHQPQEVGR